MRRPPPRPPGGGKTPGSGRKRGTPNKRTAELQALMRELVHDAAYQHRLRDDFCRRRVHPTTEVAIWTRVLGPPRQTIAVSADIMLDGRLREERELFAQLSLPDLEALATKSQALVDEARALVEAQRGKDTHPTVPGPPRTPDMCSPQSDQQGAGTDGDET